MKANFYAICILCASVCPLVGHAATIAKQGFEVSGDTWNYSNNPASYNTSGDVWDDVSSNGVISPSEGSRFWGIRDLNNPNGGGNFYHYIDFDLVDVSAYTNVQLTFEYYTILFEAADAMEYSVAYNGASFSSYTTLNDNSSAWTTVTINIPAGTNSVRLRLRAKQDGASDYAGWDNVLLTGDAANTQVEFAAAAYTETESGSSVQLCANIINPSASSATTANVVLTSASSPHLTSYSTQAISFPANSSTPQCVTVSIDNNSTCGDDASYTFELQNVSGGNTAEAGSQDQTTLSVSDDDLTSQTIAHQGFEGSGWSYTLSTMACTVGNDIWNEVSSIGSISPYNGSQFFGIRDLNGNCGGSGFETIQFSNTDISSFDNVVLSFRYKVVGFDANDDIKYEVFYDNVSQGEVILVDGSSNYSTGSWLLESISVPASVTNVKMTLKARQNGNDDYAGFDDVQLVGEGCITCNEPTTNASSVSVSGETTTTADITWTNGDGEDRIVVVKEGTSISGTPADNSTYSASASFGNGNLLNAGEYVVYNGDGSSVTVTNLTPGTEYTVQVFEYNCLPGSEDYLLPGSSTQTFLTIPEDVSSLEEVCVSNHSIDLSWTAPANGSVDGYLLVVRNDATPHAITSINPSTQTYNTNYTLAPAFGGSSPQSRVVYNGTATNVTIDGLTESESYTFIVYPYAIGTYTSHYASGTQTSETIELNDVSVFTSLAGNGQIQLSWSNPDIACFDEVLIVAKQNSSVTHTPSGDGSNYNPNSTYSPPPAQQAVYLGTGSSMVVDGLTNGTTYYFKIFVRLGTEWSAGVEISDVPNTTTVLEQGDLAIIAVNTQYQSSGGDDEICFVAFKDITLNTSIDFTDNGYERENTEEWGDTEGTIRITRTGGGTIAAGTVICIQGSGNSSFDVIVCGSNDNSNWSVQSLNTIYQYNLNSTDQIWMMQNGSWVNPVGDHDASYTGNVLYGWTATGWESNAGYASTSGSTLIAGADCFNTNVNGILNPDKVKYTGDTTEASQYTWIQRVNNSSNWTGYASNSNYNAFGLDYSGSCIEFRISNDGFEEGVWTGSEDTDWFNCTNWQNLKVPDETVDVTISSTAANDAEIDDDSPDAAEYGNIAKANNITIESGLTLQLAEEDDELDVSGDLMIENGGKFRSNTGGIIRIDGDITINNGALLDLHLVSGSNQATLYLGGDWADNNTNESAVRGFYENNSTVVFNGSGTQRIYDVRDSEIFGNITIDKPAQQYVELATNIELRNTLTYGSGGIIRTDTTSYGADGTQYNYEVYLHSSSSSSIVNANTSGTDKYIEGKLRWTVIPGNSYTFPIGVEPASLDGMEPFQVNLLSVTPASGVSLTGYFGATSLGSMIGEKLYCDVGTTVGAGSTLNTSGASAIPDGILDELTIDCEYPGVWHVDQTGGIAGSFDYSIDLLPGASLQSTCSFITYDGGNEVQYVSRDRQPNDKAITTIPNYDQELLTDSRVNCPTNAFQLTDLGNFSEFGVSGVVGGSNVTLPVEWLAFDATPINNQYIELTWSTAVEINNSGFDVERSTDGIHYVSIGWVDGVGFSNDVNQYKLYDREVQENQWYYYRIKQMDQDGRVEYSVVEKAMLSGKRNRSSLSVDIYPNPADQYVWVKSNRSDVSLRVYDTYGKELAVPVNNPSANQFYVAFDQLAGGVYILSISKEGETYTERIIVR